MLIHGSRKNVTNTYFYENVSSYTMEK